MQRVTKADYTILFDALEAISHDAGAQAGHQFHELPRTINNEVVSLVRLEITLRRLAPSERTKFTIGADHERKAIEKKLGADGAYTTRVLDVFFFTI